MARKTLALPALCLIALAGAAQAPAAQKPTVHIVVSDADCPAAKTAAQELRDGLAAIYPDERFAVVPIGDPTAGTCMKSIAVGTAKAMENLLFSSDAIKRLAGPGSYAVTLFVLRDMRSAFVLGADGPGVIYGVSALLRKLGFGFTLDGDIIPPPRKGPMTFDGWDLADRPLTPRRFVFNWHNFLSGCSSWDLEHWKRWIAQSQKMGYNAVMVHAYGNNPMAGFAFDGVDKPVGYLSSTRVGRDWATMHVNDVRRLIGGRGAFDAPVFGSAAAVAGDDAQRITAARKLMAGAFAYAQQRGVELIFAVDIDTASANPQELITRLPERARFDAGQRGRIFWLARADTPEGYAYYKAQVAALMKAYPQIDTLAIWFRTSRTPMGSVKLEQLPEDWQREYKAIVAKEPAVGEYCKSVGIFAMSKVARACAKALGELGREDVTLGVGSWGFSLMNAADRFMPEGTGIYPLNYAMLSRPPLIASREGQASLAKVAARRPLYPVLWAHHDDGKYVGPPYPPPDGFFGMLSGAKCDSAGFGIIHWTTRPLDAFFIGLSDSVWQSSRDQSAATTCRRMARAMIGKPHEQAFGRYLHDWLTNLPMVARDTGNMFIDRKLEGYEEALASHKRRMAMLDEIEEDGPLPAGAAKWLNYFRGHERFILGLHECEARFRKARELQKTDLAAARAELAKADVKGTIEWFAETARGLGITRGEQGLLVSLNLRWYTHYLRLAQQIGAKPVRINYAPTSHDPLAQSAGRYTYFVDDAGRFWDVRGEAETKAPAYGELAGYVKQAAATDTDALWEVRQSGLALEEATTLDASPMMNGRSLPPGKYRVTLLLGKAGEDAKDRPGDVEVALYIPGVKEPVTERIRLGGKPRDNTYDIDQPRAGTVKVKLTPTAGAVRVCGIVVEPVQQDQ